MIGLEKRLEVAGEAMPLVGEEVTLALGAVGRGVFRVRSKESVTRSGAVRFLAGYRGRGVVYPLLTGLVAEDAPTRPGERWVAVREPAALLEMAAGFALRHPTPREVLGAIEARAGVRFLVPGGASYLGERLPHFAAEGTCREALDALGPAWGLAHPVWTGLPDGRIWWGEWADGPWASAPLELDPRLVVVRDPDAHTLTLAYLPRLRPGVVLEVDGLRFLVQRAVFREDRVNVQWGEV